MKNESNTFVDRLNLYQSANSDTETIKNNFVIRIHEFNSIIDALKSKKEKDPLQHELILGRRGSGKSTLLKRIEIEINENKQLSKKYIPINPAEEQASIYRLSDLWFEILNELQEKEDIQLELKVFSTFSNEEEYTRYLFEEINKILKSINKKAVLLLDNFDRILGNLSKGGHLLRELLLNHNNVQIIGGSTRMDEHFWKYDQSFYEFFRQHKLDALSFKEINKLLNLWSDRMQIPQLKDFAIKNRGKIESIRILTDGLPRTLQFFIRILLSNKETYGFLYIEKIMDEATPLYQERLNNLTPPQRKIVLEMAFIWEATLTKQLVDKCRMESKLISAYLKQLISFGIVQKIDTKTKNKLYRISERFFNMWLIVTQGNPEQKRKAKYLTIFLENWYNSNEINELAYNHLRNIRTKGLSYDKAYIKTKALCQSKFITTSIRDELIEQTNILAVNDENKSYLPRTAIEVIITTDRLIKDKKYTQALAEINKIENEEDGLIFFSKGYIYHLSDDNEKAREHYLLAIKKGYTKAFDKLAILLANQGKEEEAIKYFQLAIKNGDNKIAPYNLAVLLEKQMKLEEAKKHYLLAINNGYILAMNNLASIYRIQGNTENAEKYYLLAAKNNSPEAINNLALFYFFNRKKPNEALDLIQRYNRENRSYESSQIEILIRGWNGDFKDIDKKMESMFNHKKNGNLSVLLKYLLILNQEYLVHSYFESEKYGKDLQEKYILIYYATQILNKTIGEKELKIPKEVMPTVNDIVRNIKEQAKLYSE